MKVNAICTKQYKCKKCGGRDLDLHGWRSKTGRFKWRVKCEDCGKTGTKASFGGAIINVSTESK